MKKLYNHDCSTCCFLGNHHVEKDKINGEQLNTTYDLYYCSQGVIPTVIARFGSEGSEYISGLNLANLVESLSEARKRAIQKGLLK